MTATGANDGVVQDARALLRWYEPRRTAYPWRRTSDPYAILVGEVMLQQTQAARVAPVFERFLVAFPTIGDLATASTSDVLRVWDGLGYNRRAVALLHTAQRVIARHGGRLPIDPAELRGLPGIGPYTAAAVASIAFGVRVAAVDTNVRRIVTRVFDARDGNVRGVADRWVHPTRPGDWNQALMDLGREVCRPVPRCTTCPLRRRCASASRSEMPVRPAIRRQSSFEGSFRQLRGAIVRELRHRGPLSIASLASATGRATPDVERAVAALAREGLVDAGAAASTSSVAARVRLPA